MNNLKVSVFYIWGHFNFVGTLRYQMMSKTSYFS